MIKKKIEKAATLKPKKKSGYSITVQEVENILVLNVFFKGKLYGRHAINPETGEYEQYTLVVDTWEWKQYKFGNLLGADTHWYGYYSHNEVEEKMKFDTPEMEELVREKLMAKKIGWKVSTYRLIDSAESEYQRTKKANTEKNRWNRVKDKMNLVPELPKELREWIWKQHGGADFAFRNKETGEWSCSNCKSTYPESELRRVDKGKKVRHNDMVICPSCKKEIMAKKRQEEITEKTHCSIMQAMDYRYNVHRHFDVKIKWNDKGREIRLSESVRVLMSRLSEQPKYVAEIFYNQYGTAGVYAGPHGWDYEYSEFDYKGNPANRRIYEEYLYQVGVEDAMKDTAYQTWGRIFSQMAAGGVCLNYNRLMMTQNDESFANMVECLYKGRFHRLLRESAEKVSWWTEMYDGPLYKSGDCIEAVFDIPDRQLINRIRDVDGGEEVVRWMRWSYESGQKISQEALDWVCKNNVTQFSIKFIKDRMSLQQIMNYVRRQQEEGYKGKSAKQVMDQWEDYLSMLSRLGKKADDEMIFRPRELKRRHNECVEEINRLRIIEEMKRDKKPHEEEAKKMREKFPGAEEVLEEIREKYEYQSEKYMIVVPKTLLEIIIEGQALHHCAGATDRYFDRIRQRETYICFLRKTADPGTPYYTIEVEPGGTIRQHRGMCDEEPGIEEIKTFLREWQQEIRKRMSKKDHEYAKNSARKRQENIEELKAKNNTKVLKGLMEDFMEAI